MLREESVKKALSEGADEAEALEVMGKKILIQVEKNAVKTASSVRFTGLGVRAAIGKKLGFAFATNPTNGNEIGKKAVMNARSSPEDLEFKGLPEPASISYMNELLDPKLRDLDVEEAASLFMTSIEAAKISPKVISISGSFELRHLKISIYSSKGVDVMEERTYFSAEVEAASQDGYNRGSGFGFSDGRKLDMFDPENVGKEAGELAIRTLDSMTIGVEEIPLILKPKAQFTIVPFIAGQAANAENIQYGRSFLTGKLSEKIAKDEVSIVDDGRIPWLGGSSSFDAEGIPTRRTYIVERGTFKALLHNWYTASKEGKESTGNASRDYTHLPSISPHTVSIEAPSLQMKFDELIDVKRGVLVVYTIDTPNLATGEFSGMAETSFLVENGEITKSLRQTSMAFTLGEFLRGIDGIGDDVEAFSSFKGGSVRIRAKVAGPGAT